MIDSNCNKYALELIHNKHIEADVPYTFEFSSIYHEIINISKTAPLYLIYPTDELQAFALQIKDLSLQLSNTLKQYFKTNSDNPLKQLKLMVTTSECIQVKPLGQPVHPKYYDIQINRVAKGQCNNGKYVPKKICPFTSQTYSFSIQADTENLDFEVPVKMNSSNEEILSQVANLINRTANNIEALVLDDGFKIALSLRARAHRRNQPAHFSIHDTTPNGIISYYGLNTVSSEPTPSDFLVNGEPFHSFGVAFSIDDLFEMTLIKHCADTIRIAFEFDKSAVANEIDNLQNILNSLLELASSCKKHTLEIELVHFLNCYRSKLARLGIKLNNLNKLTTDYESLENSISDHSIEDFLTEEQDFTLDLIEQSHMIATDPMKYVPNKVVSYKDHTKINYPNPYQISSYSGFLFTNYC